MAKQTMSSAQRDEALALGVAPSHIDQLHALPFSIPWDGILQVVRKYGPSIVTDLLRLFLNIQPDPAAGENPPKPPAPPGPEPAFRGTAEEDKPKKGR